MYPVSGNILGTADLKHILIFFTFMLEALTSSYIKCTGINIMAQIERQVGNV